MQSQIPSAKVVRQRIRNLELNWEELRKGGTAVSNGAFCDLFQGQLQKGDISLRVAIKKLRIIVQSDDNDKKVRVHTTSTKPISQILLAL